MFPFSAVVGSDDMALALTLSAVSPSIGGVLVRGEKGTAKTTMVRAQAALLPAVEVVAGCRFACDPADPDPQCPDGPHAARAETAVRPARLVELPVGASEDRVTGALHLGRVLAEGAAEYEPGLLAEAHRGILYVDEVNLLHDHLVDLLLDAAATGRSTVERDGVSVSHASRFVLVGTMNPEEGELRPQLLDRFGLSVEVAAPRDPDVRVEIVRRRMAFEADPVGFRRRWEAAEQELAGRIVAARELLGRVELTDAALHAIAEVCAGLDVDGMRADLVTAKAAAAHAAWSGRTTVTREDIAAAARLALPHRRRRGPLDDHGLDDEQLEQLLGPDDPEDPDPDPDPGGPGPDGDGPDDGPDTDSGPGTAESAPAEPEPEPGDDSGPDAGDEQAHHAPPAPPAGADDAAHDHDAPAPVSVAMPEDPFTTRLLAARRTGSGAAGRRSKAETTIGRTVGARRGDTGAVHLPATVRATAVRGALDAADTSADRGDGPDAAPRRFGPGTEWDLRRKVVEGREANLVLLCVDASGSMAARKRMAQVKSAVISLLLDAYRRRDTVGLVTFRGAGAELVLPPTGSVDVAARRMRELPAGGRTPLAEGLTEAGETIRRHRRRDPDLRALLIVVTDGRATAGEDAVDRSLTAADALAADGIDAVVLDSETGRFRLGLARTLAARLGAEYLHVGDIEADTIVTTVRGRAA